MPRILFHKCISWSYKRFFSKWKWFTFLFKLWRNSLHGLCHKSLIEESSFIITKLVDQKSNSTLSKINLLFYLNRWLSISVHTYIRFIVAIGRRKKNILVNSTIQLLRISLAQGQTSSPACCSFATSSSFQNQDYMYLSVYYLPLRLLWYGHTQ